MATGGKNNECDYVMPPKTGILARASIGIIFSTLCFTWSLSGQILHDDELESMNNFNSEIIAIRLLPEDSPELYKNVHLLCTLLLMFMNILDVIVRSCLIWGVMQDKPSLMLPSICMDITTIYTMIAIVHEIFSTPSLSWGDIIMLAFEYLAMLCIIYHFFVVNSSYYEDLCCKIDTYPGHMAPSQRKWENYYL